ncbi:hypothetical protein FNV43_RR26774 [Rhamnella rubrinervis]|uniref:Uncharacterized protein n=1 Tax=Rhamnella rubrinervis TaxID=2594499 RepID=A0A8K0DJD9_9ROSA|nr:hypothetical protein FNV43_RR26774 [Rhamnella rubrinervis]
MNYCAQMGQKMGINIKSSRTIFPIEPTPNGKMELSAFDQIKIYEHISLVYIYKSKNSIEPGKSAQYACEILRNSLSQALVPYYPLAGRLSWSERGRLELHCSAKGVLLLEAECEATLAEVGHFGASQELKQLVPKVDYSSGIEEIPLVTVQLTKFKCGGVGVGVGISRTMVDGLGSFAFSNAWIKLARGEKLDVMPFYDRNVFKSTCGNLNATTPRFDHIEYTQWQISRGSNRLLADTSSSTNEESLVMLKLTKEQLQNLKMVANFGTHRPFSSFEVLAGHIWRCACKARYKGDSRQPTRVSIMVDCRHRLKPILPAGYFGNAALPTLTSPCLFGDIMYEPLCYAAEKIREATAKMTDEYIRSAIDVIENHNDMDVLRKTYIAPDINEEDNPNVSVVSWMNMPPLLDADFGWGQPLFFSPILDNYEGKFLLMPCFEGDHHEGSLTVYVCLNAKHMKSFKRFFYEDIRDIPFQPHSRF